MKFLKIFLVLSLLSPAAFADTAFPRKTQVDNTTIEYNSNQLRVKDSGITSAKIADGTIATADIGNSQVTAAKTTALVGAKVSKSIDTIYQAATDGFVTAVCDVDNGDDFRIYTDSATPPSVQVQRIQTGSGTTAFTGSMSALIKKSDYYEVITASGTCSSPVIYFTPIGS